MHAVLNEPSYNPTRMTRLKPNFCVRQCGQPSVSAWGPTGTPHRRHLGKKLLRMQVPAGDGSVGDSERLGEREHAATVDDRAGQGSDSVLPLG